MRLGKKLPLRACYWIAAGCRLFSFSFRAAGTGHCWRQKSWWGQSWQWLSLSLILMWANAEQILSKGGIMMRIYLQCMGEENIPFYPSHLTPACPRVHGYVSVAQCVFFCLMSVVSILKWRRFNWVSSPMEQQNVFFPPSASPARQRHPLTDTCTASTQLDVNQSLCLCILLVRPNLHQWMYWPHKAGKCNFRDEKMKQRDRPHSSMPKFAQKVSARPGNQALV